MLGSTYRYVQACFSTWAHTTRDATNSSVVWSVTCLDFILRTNLGATKSSTSRLMSDVLMAGDCDGCCMLRKLRIDCVSDSYELSAIVLPLDARRNAAIHLAYCDS